MNRECHTESQSNYTIKKKKNDTHISYQTTMGAKETYNIHFQDLQNPQKKPLYAKPVR